ncbi:flagellar protein [Bacillus sp. FJAT-44742]|uniref:flagellar protein n=1 Tax=Bacillus sp. FJAT-44742 TaxID=2014005 RepID=UPI000C243150|nr:flagellar protein [Bacillus sp. FJAT-44742]
MSKITSLFLATKTLDDHLSRELPKGLDERDEYIIAVEDYLQSRDRLLKEILQEKPSFSETERKLGMEVLSMNGKIEEQMAKIQSVISADIRALKKKRKTGQRYENPYQGTTVDGVFFDSKK